MLYTKHLERIKYLSLLSSNDNFESIITLPNSCQEDIAWWLTNIKTAMCPIRKNKFALEIETDASLTGWGARCNNKTASGPWTQEEAKLHINMLELHAAFLGLKSFAKDKHDCEILLRIDNTTAISYINRLGGIQYQHLHNIYMAVV